MEKTSPTTLFPPIELPDESTSRLDPAALRVVRRSLSILGVLSAVSLAGVASSLYLVNNYPLLLIALSPIGRHLILVASTVDPTAFVLVAVCRRLLFYGPCFQLGRSLGPSALLWFDARSRWAGRFVRWLQSLFERASHAVVFFLPGPAMSTIAGMSDMPGRVYVGLITAGLTFRMLLVVSVADLLREPIEEILALIARHWVPGTAIMVLGTLLYQWWRIRRTRWHGES